MAGIVIHSDDLGLSRGVNEAIAQAFKKGWISSASMLVNFKESFTDAISLIKQGAIPANAVGIHLNLTQGQPITREIHQFSRIVKNGRFVLKRNKLFFLTKREKEAIFNELNAQVRMMMVNGVSPYRIDSHHHIHTEPAILPLVLTLCHRYNIKLLRISRNVGTKGNLLKSVWRLMVNARIRQHGLGASDYFGDINDYVTAGKVSPLHNIEVMVHARLNQQQEIVDYDGNLLEVNIARLNQLMAKA